MTRRALLKNLALALFSLPWLPKILGAQERKEPSRVLRLLANGGEHVITLRDGMTLGELQDAVNERNNWRASIGPEGLYIHHLGFEEAEAEFGWEYPA